MKNKNTYRSIFESFLNERRWGGEPASVYEPIQYILSIGGKRFRPVLTLLSGDTFGEVNAVHLEMALGIEVFHNFTLLHDDIMDQADLRRGQEAVHKKFGTNAAILSGDLMLILATQIINSTCHSMSDLDDVMELFLRVGQEVCEGQERDMIFETAEDVSMDDYEEMVRQKTAVLLGFSLYAGARASGVSVEQANALYQFGVQSGIVFQIWDDYLDVFAEDTTGKRAAGDIYNKKETCLIISLRDRMSNSDAEMFSQIWSGDKLIDSEVEFVKKLLDQYKIKDQIGRMARTKIQEAKQNVNQFFPPDQLTSLFSFIDQFIDRNN